MFVFGEVFPIMEVSKSVSSGCKQRMSKLSQKTGEFEIGLKQLKNG